VHPLALAAGSDDPGVSQVSQVPRDLRLRLVENFHKIADANLLISHKVQEPEPGAVSKRLKEAFHAKSFSLLAITIVIIYALTDV